MTTAEIATNAKISEKARGLVKDDLSPPRFLDLLESEKLFGDAVAFLAHALPVPLAVKWGCNVCRELMPPDAIEKATPSLEAAEAWMGTPSWRRFPQRQMVRCLRTVRPPDDRWNS
jgi:hypothetical protein